MPMAFSRNSRSVVRENRELVRALDPRLMLGYYFGEEGGNMCKGKVSGQIYPWCIVDLSFDIFLAQLSWKVLDILHA